MYSNSIKKLSVLTKLVQKYISKDITNIMKLVLDLANLLDLFDPYNIDLKKFKKAIENNNVQFSEHWQKRHNFLLIILEHWHNILHSLHLNNEPIINKLNSVNTNIYNKYSDCINLVKLNNEFAEINYLFKQLRNFSERNFSKVDIVCPSDKLRKLINIRSNFENINIDNVAFSVKEFDYISKDFKEQVFYDFKYFNESDLKIITKILSFLDIKLSNEKYNIRLLDINNINIINNPDAIFYMSMDLQNWKISRSGVYWLHSSLYNKLKLPNNKIGLSSLLKHNSKIFLMYSNVYNGKSVKKSNLLNNIEVSNIKINYIENIKENIQNETKTQLIKDSAPNIFVIPETLSGKDINNLLYDPKVFYISKNLSLESTDYNEKISNIAKSFQEMFYCFFNKEKYCLTQLKDNIYCKKFTQVYQWLLKYPMCEKEFNNINLESSIPDLNIKIISHCDRIEINNNEIKIIKYKISNNFSKKEILEGRKTSMLIQSLVLKYGNLFIDFYKYNIKLEIWSINWNSNVPIYKQEIAVPQNIIDDFYIKIKDVLKSYLLTSKITLKSSDNKLYKHFERNINE